MPTRDQHDRNGSLLYFRLFRRQMSLLLSINYALLHDRYIIMIVAFCLYKYFPLAVCSAILCVLLRQSPPEVIMFGFIPSRGKANALMYLN